MEERTREREKELESSIAIAFLYQSTFSTVTFKLHFSFLEKEISGTKKKIHSNFHLTNTFCIKA
jgi:hypothetical protein